MNQIDEKLLREIADLEGVPQGAYNIRKNGKLEGRSSSAHITIDTKANKPGIDIHIAPGTRHESVHIPVIVTETGLKDLVYNDFFIGADCDVDIIAGCGIHNTGCETAEHDGIHTFYVGKNARVRYVEKHYGEGPGTGKRILTWRRGPPSSWRPPRSGGWIPPSGRPRSWWARGPRRSSPKSSSPTATRPPRAIWRSFWTGRGPAAG